jgi:hypothetical protein
LVNQQIGARFGGHSPWIPLHGSSSSEPLQLSLPALQGIRCIEKDDHDWKPPEFKDSIDQITLSFLTQVKNNPKFSDNPKIHLVDASIDDKNELVLVTAPARYSENAALSHYIGERLYGLQRLSSLSVEKAHQNIKEVLDKLIELGIFREGFSPLDISLSNESPFPKTLGGSVVLITSDGYLIEAQQNRDCIASANDIVPAISYSVDPVAGTKCRFTPLKDPLREGAEEQDLHRSSMASLRLIGIAQSLHRMGKPELVYALVVNYTLEELKDASSSDVSRKTKYPDVIKKLPPDDLIKCIGAVKGAGGENIILEANLRTHTSDGVRLTLSDNGFSLLLEQALNQGYNHVNSLAKLAVINSAIEQH